MRVLPVVVKIAAAGLTKIPVSDQAGFLSSRFTARSDRRNRLFQKIDAGASGLIVTMTMDTKNGPDCRSTTPGSAPAPHIVMCGRAAFCCDTRRSPKFNFIVVPRRATKLQVDNVAP